MRNGSPYFQKRKPTASPGEWALQSSTTQSSHFSIKTSQISCFESVEQLAPLIFTLSESSAPCFPCRRSSVCECSTGVINDCKAQFYFCDQFRASYESFQHPTSSSEDFETKLTCWERENIRIQHSVRHLCSNRCYMRAFAPVREWVSLRESVQEMTDVSLGMIDCVLHS